MQSKKETVRQSGQLPLLTDGIFGTGLGDAASPLSLDGAPKIVHEPYAASIAAGKNTYVYDAHTYHTKVPPQGIARLIEYYTHAGDVVLDPFCGSGMTGVAATELGRSAIISDISPAAVFIARNLNTPIDHARYLNAVKQVLDRAKDLELQLYGTTCRRTGIRVPMLYMVWSYGLLCSSCGKEFVLWDVARDEKPSVRESKIKREFPCPHCQHQLHKRALKRTKRYPVQVGYRISPRQLKEDTASPSEEDMAVLQQIEREGIPTDLWYPRNKFPRGINTRQPIAAGIDSIDKAYTTRALFAMAYLWKEAMSWDDEAIRDKLLFTLTSLYQRVTVFSEFRFWGGSSNTANFNVPHIMNEQNVFRAFARKADTISWYFRDAPKHDRQITTSTRSACNLSNLPDKSVDYVFADPPFGGNINYSEMNFLWECWLKDFTNNREEAIVNAVQGKGLAEYEDLLLQAFREIRRVIKDHAWFTVVFHNSSEKVWKALQNALINAGFHVRGTQTFDKKHGTFKMFVSDNAVGYDLVLHCQKTGEGRPLQPEAGVSVKDIEEQVVAFVRDQLRANGSNYVVHYLHVKRTDEVDFRRLYSEWLSESVSRQMVEVSFAKFRELASLVLLGNGARGQT
jgi:DNA modification methylase/DNA-directed RNA polymerase subunit RPC12/RpoP